MALNIAEMGMMKIWNMIAVLAVMLLLCSCAGTGNELLFDQSCGETVVPLTLFEHVSPSQQFAIVSGCPDENKSGLTVLTLVEKKSGQTRLLGCGNRSVGVDWYATQTGDVAVINHMYDTHQNEIFVIYPKVSPAGELQIMRLYSLPPLNLIPFRGDNAIDHYYWSVTKIDPAGVMTLHGSWDFSMGQPGLDQTFVIPLFYGTSVDGSGGHAAGMKASLITP